ncbi:MAG: hypothetical protein JNM88_00325 [Chitinophagaceae bacterium]|nr:hypothetical protein [Chitinophagaceae bacterium]
MIKMRNLLPILAIPVLILAVSCNKSSTGNDTDPGAYKLSYGDSILYMKPGGGSIVFPTTHRDGQYSGFPDGIEIDDATGAIDLEKSETGLRYRITHTATDGTVTTTMVVLSGITFRDHFYNLASGDSIALPVYNAENSRVLPLSGSTFDEGNVANGGGCSVRTDNGKINLKETIRNGVFGFPPRNDAQETFEIKYRINDASGKSLNKLKVLLYWYNTVADVPQYVWDILNDRTTQGVFLKGGDPATGRPGQVAKPRPPCVIIVDH